MQYSQKNFYQKLLGRTGEQLAVKYLKKLGYKLIKRNYTCKIGEADIICSKGEMLCFIEVKTRENDYFGRPSEAVGKYKQHTYRNIANYYILQNQLQNKNVMFCVVEVMGSEINLIENAF